MIEQENYFEEGKSEHEAIETVTPSELLIERLSERFVASKEEVGKLIGQRVKIIYPSEQNYCEETIGNVIAADNHEITYLPDTLKRYLNDGFTIRRALVKGKDPQVIKAEFITTDPYQLDEVDLDDPTVTRAIFTFRPNRISIRRSERSSEIVAFNRKDEELDRYLNQLLKYFPNLNTMEDVGRLSEAVHLLVPYRKGEPSKGESPYRVPSLGKEIEHNEAVCRHINALAMAVLELKGISVTPVTNAARGSETSHLYLAIDAGIEGQKERIIVDPTWNVYGTYDTVIKKTLPERGLVTAFHQPANAVDLTVFPDWGYMEYDQ